MNQLRFRQVYGNTLRVPVLEPQSFDTLQNVLQQIPLRADYLMGLVRHPQACQGLFQVRPPSLERSPKLVDRLRSFSQCINTSNESIRAFTVSSDGLKLCER